MSLCPLAKKCSGCQLQNLTYEEQLRMEKERLNNMSEKELLIELVMELKKIDRKCDDIARKIVVWSN